MAKKQQQGEEKSIPASRAGRLARMARMAGGVAGGMLAESGRQLRAGRRPRAKDLLLTPGNARRVAEQLATMRGAAMKVGQMLSMDSGDFLPRELADILARLRQDAHYMPATQLNEVMVDAYGEDWESQFYGFDMKPIAAASIGQVHRAVSADGREIALKVQYPGVARSIDSDVDNIATLLRMSGLLPETMDIKPLLSEAKAQLHDEADYLKEAQHLQKFRDLLAADDRFVLPDVLPELSRKTVLVMTYVAASPIETLESCSQDDRDRVMTSLFELMFHELFELRLVQTDPNLANYRFRPETGEIILLDFGATRSFKATFANDYRRLLKAALAGDTRRLVKAAERLGYAMGDEGSEYREFMQELFLLVLEPLQTDTPFDFAKSDLAARLSVAGEEVTAHREFWNVPPTDAIYFHRKLGGLFMMATRLKARVNLRALVEDFV